MSSETSQASLSGTKVLVVDDSEIIRRTAITLLSQAGCEVSTAVNGFEALARLVDDPPQVIFVDTMMPHLDGYQTCALLKNHPRYRAIPVVILTNRDGLFDRARSRIVGADHSLAKPFTRDELLNAVLQHHLRRAE